MIAIGVNDPGGIDDACPFGGILKVGMNMAVQKKPRPVFPDKPAETGESPMAEILPVVNASRRGMGDHHIDSPAPPNGRSKMPNMGFHLFFGILVRAAIVPHGSFQS
jgi:hypothetical protein